MNAIQKTSSVQQETDEGQTTLLKVPKLTLKLSKPFQKPDDSEQSSSESESDSDNENEIEVEEDDNVTENMSNKLELSDEKLQQSFLQSTGEQNDQQSSLQEQYSYNENNSLLETCNTANDFGEHVNDSGSTAKNTSIDSDKSAGIENDFQMQNTLLAQSPPSLSPTPPSQTPLESQQSHIESDNKSQIYSHQEPISDEIGQTSLIANSNETIGINVCVYLNNNLTEIKC